MPPITAWIPTRTRSTSAISSGWAESPRPPHYRPAPPSPFWSPRPAPTASSRRPSSSTARTSRSKSTRTAREWLREPQAWWCASEVSTINSPTGFLPAFVAFPFCRFPFLSFSLLALFPSCHGSYDGRSPFAIGREEIHHKLPTGSIRWHQNSPQQFTATECPTSPPERPLTTRSATPATPEAFWALEWSIEDVFSTFLDGRSGRRPTGITAPASLLPPRNFTICRASIWLEPSLGVAGYLNVFCPQLSADKEKRSGPWVLCHKR